MGQGLTLHSLVREHRCSLKRPGAAWGWGHTFPLCCLQREIGLSRQTLWAGAVVRNSTDLHSWTKSKVHGMET